MEVSVSDNINEALISQLVDAAAQGNRSEVIRLIEAGVNVDGQCAHTGHTALISATASGRDLIVAYLLSIGIDINFAGKYRRTALHTSCINDDLGLSELLCQHGADISLLDDYEKTPISYLRYEHHRVHLTDIASNYSAGLK